MNRWLPFTKNITRKASKFLRFLRMNLEDRNPNPTKKFKNLSPSLASNSQSSPRPQSTANTRIRSSTFCAPSSLDSWVATSNGISQNSFATAMAFPSSAIHPPPSQTIAKKTFSRFSTSLPPSLPLPLLLALPPLLLPLTPTKALPLQAQLLARM